jgi:hypothetical protein
MAATEYITPDVDRMDDTLVQLRLAKLKELYDRGLTSEAMYYQNQCELFQHLREKHAKSEGTKRGDGAPGKENTATHPKDYPGHHGRGQHLPIQTMSFRVSSPSCPDIRKPF